MLVLEPQARVCHSMDSDMATTGDSGSGMERGTDSGRIPWCRKMIAHRLRAWWRYRLGRGCKPGLAVVHLVPGLWGTCLCTGQLSEFLIDLEDSNWGSRHLGWLGRRGLCWADLPGLLQDAMKRWEKPHVLIIHLGGNDLGSIPGWDLSAVIQSDLCTFKAWMPGVRMGWSNIIPRLTWRHMASHRTAFQVRKKLNRDVRKLMFELRGFVVEHKTIAEADRSLYRGDGVHLSNHGMDLFIEDLRQSLLLFV
ncbi:uncharacterized protein LOC128661226 [Bombina bombina]|uniref:uncharacterized protein LOC128661226 n=1 Tax=Bombina bombina TaxID=8345 RepID=UPI00235B0BDB|nr:uncharacterized protein LOC128661226 [Bombina bombina]